VLNLFVLMIMRAAVLFVALAHRSLLTLAETCEKDLATMAGAKCILDTDDEAYICTLFTYLPQCCVDTKEWVNVSESGRIFPDCTAYTTICSLGTFNDEIVGELFGGPRNSDPENNCCACGKVGTCDDNIQNQDEEGVDCGGNHCEARCPTCKDGIQNQDEEGLDCGGPNCPPCDESCTDGIKNQDEEGIDCGGSCPTACASEDESPCVDIMPPLSWGMNCKKVLKDTDNCELWKKDSENSVYCHRTCGICSDTGILAKHSIREFEKGWSCRPNNKGNYKTLNRIGSVDDCKRLCLSDPDCKFAAYGHNKGRCKLKTQCVNEVFTRSNSSSTFAVTRND